MLYIVCSKPTYWKYTSYNHLNQIYPFNWYFYTEDIILNIILTLIFELNILIIESRS